MSPRATVCLIDVFLIVLDINGERNKLYQTDNVLARVLLVGSINCCFFPLIVLVESKKKKEYLQTYPLNCL